MEDNSNSKRIAMRQALELALDWIKKQPEETPESKYDLDTRYVVLRELEAALAQPEQEPVAWLSDDERKAFQRFYETWDDGEGYDVPKPMMKRLAQIGVIHHISRGLYDITKFGHSLLGYATSSQRKPLTDEQLKEIWLKGKDHGDDWLDVQGIARAIEAAHGIKE